MKTTRILSIAMALAMGMIAGLHASVTEHQPPAPLPEFKTPEQLAKWRAETTARTSAQEASRTTPRYSSTPFYTGKPYLAESGSYAFKYREYNPEMGRWTTVDPSGFPDGANNRVYAARPNSQFDSLGTVICELTYDITTRVLTINDINGYSSYNMHSGDDNPSNQIKVNGGGPIPVGSYSVFTRNQGAKYFKTTGYGAFILDPNDSTTLDDGWNNGPSQGRYGFRLHLQPTGQSDGCICTSSTSVFTSIYNNLMSTIDPSKGTTTITSNWNGDNSTFHNESFIGELKVIE